MNKKQKEKWEIFKENYKIEYAEYKKQLKLKRLKQAIKKEKEGLER